MSIKLIGLSGYKGAGKTSVTDQAINSSPTRRVISRIGFADPIIHGLVGMGVPAYIANNKSKWNDPIHKFGGKTMRYLADTLGSSWGRDIVYSDLWSNLAIDRAHDLITAGLRDAVIIDNVRFPNEQNAIWQAGGKIIAFHRNGLVPDKESQAEQHVELIQSQADEEFYNTGDDLESNATRFAELIKRLVA